MATKVREVSARLESQADGPDVWRTGESVYRWNVGDEVTFRSDGRDVRVWIPDAAIFGEEFIDLNQANGWAATLVVGRDLEISAPLDQDFAFYMVGERRMAEAASPPKMIIDP